MVQQRRGVGGKKKMSCEETYNETSARKEDRVYVETRESAQGDDEEGYRCGQN